MFCSTTMSPERSRYHDPVAQPLLVRRGVRPRRPIDLRAVVERLTARVGADGALPDALLQLHHRRRLADLESHVEAQSALRPLADLDHPLRARHVDRDRLLAVRVLACRDHGLEVQRMKVRRRRDLDDVHVLRFARSACSSRGRETAARAPMVLRRFSPAARRSARAPPRAGRRRDRPAPSPARPHWSRSRCRPPCPRPPTPRMPSRTAELAWLPRTDCGLTMVKPAVVAAVALRNSRRPNRTCLLRHAFILRLVEIRRAFYSRAAVCARPRAQRGRPHRQSRHPCSAHVPQEATTCLRSASRARNTRTPALPAEMPACCAKSLTGMPSTSICRNASAYSGFSVRARSRCTRRWHRAVRAVAPPLRSRVRRLPRPGAPHRSDGNDRSTALRRTR